jgi:Ni,Fe-hydrogenase III large subunit/NADH:ubiquinone oxidoreductase subunit C
MSYVSMKNNQTISLKEIPVVSYDTFVSFMKTLMGDLNNHCVSYFGYPNGKDTHRFFAVVANDNNAELAVLSYELHDAANQTLDSLTKDMSPLHIFEREIHENFGVKFKGHPWLKPVRYAWNRSDQSKQMTNYPFFKLDGIESHEVGVGPIHAGVIEPGHFRFSCYGENVHHLEIQLGYQHRGVEYLFLEKKKLLQRNILAESITGDTVIGHTLAFVHNMEALYGIQESLKQSVLRTIASELERIAIHTANLSAICQDIAYQLGSSVLGALRTPIINYFQWWCGNRFAKGLLRVGYNPYPFTKDLRERLLTVLEDYERKYVEMADEMLGLPSVRSRLDLTGVVTREQARLIGSVGLAARMAGLSRDIRTSHPYSYYQNLFYMPAVEKSGDAMAHASVRDQEIRKSIRVIRYLVDEFEKYENEPAEERPNLAHTKLKEDTFAISLTEGWRGEICHVAITDSEGELAHYKVKDPSMHNWFSLALALRDNEISDFPVCNKSYDQSYCGFDL